MKILGIIPSRYHSTRLPKKSLLPLGDKTVVQRTYEQCMQSKFLTDVVVATDHELIEKEVLNFGGNVVMTSSEHQSGTDRCAEVVQKIEKSYDFIINIQGDEPFIKPEAIDELASILSEQVELATLVKKITDFRELFDASKPKVILNSLDQAIYFSRHPIPFQRNHEQGEWLDHHTYFKHIGMYAYRSDILDKITKLKPSSLEIAESLEQLRWIENGYKIQVNKTQYESMGIDTPDDYVRAKKLFE